MIYIVVDSECEKYVGFQAPGLIRKDTCNNALDTIAERLDNNGGKRPYTITAIEEE